MKRRSRHALGARLFLATLAISASVDPTTAAGQEQSILELLTDVMPGAQRFEDRAGNPPVYRGFATDPTSGEEVLVGYAFFTSDLPPEELGYSGPIEALVGLDIEGRLTGMRVTYYYESYRESRGDFLSARGFQEQYAGKAITEPFRAKRDIDVVARATITTAALSRGVRNAARRVWNAYSATSQAKDDIGSMATITLDELEGLDWPALVASGLVPRVDVVDDGRPRMELYFAYLKEPAVGTWAIGESAFQQVLDETPDDGVARTHWLIGVDGALAALYRPQAVRMVQDGDTVSFGDADDVSLGEPLAGAVSGQFRQMSVLLVDESIDIDREFDIVFDLRPGMGVYSAQFVPATPAIAAPPPEPPVSPDEQETPPADQADDPVAAATVEVAPTPEEEPEPAVDSVTPAVAEVTATDENEPVSEIRAAPPVEAAPSESLPPPQAFLDSTDEENALQRTLARTTWTEVTWLLAVLMLATVAFFKKSTPVRAAALAATILYLGIIDGGFLSVSHISASIAVGPRVFLGDLPLLIMVSFTVATTLIWGRVFCGFLCPFGALQDVIDWIVPKRFKKELPVRVHEKLFGAKYLILGIVLIPALIGSQTVIFQYFEPFGTVFFLSSSAVLWGIAGAFLLASAIIPRFYCRYACPLGASLALASLVAPSRIGRVEQCTVCKVCEQQCPTGAITNEKVNFKECVRCNICETKLIERAGVCRHPMERVQPRLVQLPMAKAATSEPAAHR